MDRRTLASADRLGNVPRTERRVRHVAARLSRILASTLPPAAARILAAAREVLVTKGFAGLTLKAIAEESGENSAMVQYYFGNKAGLVTALIDSNFRDDLAGVTVGHELGDR